MDGSDVSIQLQGTGIGLFWSGCNNSSDRSSGISVAALLFTVTACGFCVTGGQIASNVAAYYPTAIRSTGVGWCLGIGRLGSIIGPVWGGVVLISAGHETNRAFLIIAVPELIAMTSAFADSLPAKA